jgi:hypothetical protein
MIWAMPAKATPELAQAAEAADEAMSVLLITVRDAYGLESPQYEDARLVYNDVRRVRRELAAKP